MNNSNGTLNISRLIEEAEALLMGETKQCSNCGNCKNGKPTNEHCANRANAKSEVRRPVLSSNR
ncbi:MAG: hypothetical protein H7Z14_03015 [Anaerolineae bacterium]|nr:hypothetical protein [Phycisphaerae bacterium]